VSGDEYPINLLVAATSIYDAEKGELYSERKIQITDTKQLLQSYTILVTSPSKKEELLTAAIEALSSEEEGKSFARAHALYLRADARLDLDNIDDKHLLWPHAFCILRL